MKYICFKANPCDPCVSNKMICDKQMTITWYFNDLLVSHAEKDIIEDFIQ